MRPRPPSAVVLQEEGLGARSSSEARLPWVRAKRVQGRASDGGHEGVAVEAVLAVKVWDIAGLTEAVHAERDDAMADHRAEPGQGRRMAVKDGDQRRPG